MTAGKLQRPAVQGWVSEQRDKSIPIDGPLQWGHSTVENYFCVFKRGMRGTYQHCKEKHLHRYLAEFDFRYNKRVKRGINDEARAGILLDGIIGKRLTYQTAKAR